MKKAGYTEEQDGSRSMRRLLALYYAILSGVLLMFSALRDNMAAVYAGLGCSVVVLVLLGLATVSDIKLRLPLIDDGSHKSHHDTWSDAEEPPYQAGG